MIWHPLVWAFWAGAATGSVLYAAAALYAIDVVVNHRPARADARQLKCERRAEAAVLLGKWALGSFAAAAMIGLIGITRVWHDHIPGAMCGTGVLQAMGADGSRALAFWSATLATLYAWRALAVLDGRSPETPMVRRHARILLLASPFLVLAVIGAWKALMRIDAAPPVSCCAAIYDRVLVDSARLASRAGFNAAALYLSLAGTVILPITAALALRHPRRHTGGTVALLALAWALSSATAVKTTWSAYYYQVLSHPCPWCLFLAEYYGVGFLIFGCLAAVALESLALWAAQFARRHHPQLAEPALARGRQALHRIALAIVIFLVMTIGPAIIWRLSTGVWMDGSG